MFPWWVPELLREFRYFTSTPTSCPWGAIGLTLVLSCIASTCFGFILGALVFSATCRRAITGVLRLALSATVIQPELVRVPDPDLRGRLTQYRRPS